MRFLPGLFGALCLAGCAHHPPPSVALPQPKAVITPDLRPIGRVEMVNLQARFVVLSFRPGAMPSLGQILNIDHKGLKIGEVKVTGPEHGEDTVADIVEGDAYTGDEAEAQ